MSIIIKVKDYLEGKKTFIIAAVIAVLNIAVSFNLISPSHLVAINTVLGALGLAAIRSSINKL